MTVIQPRIREWKQATNHSLQGRSSIRPPSMYIQQTVSSAKSRNAALWGSLIIRPSSSTLFPQKREDGGRRISSVRVEKLGGGRLPSSESRVGRRDQNWRWWLVDEVWFSVGNSSFAQTPTYVDFNVCANIFWVSSVLSHQDWGSALVHPVVEQGPCADDDRLHRK